MCICLLGLDTDLLHRKQLLVISSAYLAALLLIDDVTLSLGLCDLLTLNVKRGVWHILAHLCHKRTRTGAACQLGLKLCLLL